MQRGPPQGNAHADVVPSWGAERIENEPCRCSARSRMPISPMPWPAALFISGLGFKAFAIIADFQVQLVFFFAQRYPRFPRAGMARHVAQRFLHDAINVDGRLGREKSVGKLPA